MKKIVVFREPLARQYKAPRFSLTYLFIVLCNLSIVFLPFSFYTSTDGRLWTTHSTYREQPEVKFQYKSVIVLEATSKTSGQTKEVFVSNLESLNGQRPESYRLANVQFNEEDVDLDGKIDSCTLEADVPLGEDEPIQSVQAVLFFDYRVQQRVKFDTEAVAYTSVDSSLPLSGFDTTGSLVLRQTNSLGIRDYFSELYSEETPLVDTNDLSLASVSDSNIGTILAKYRERNVAVDYVERYPVKSRASSGEANTFHLKMKVDVPEQDIIYIPTLVEVLKDGWVKYLSVVVLCWYLVERIKGFVLKSHL